MSDVKGCIYINGEYFSPDEAKLSVLDRAFWGVSVFDALSLINGYLFKVEAHIDRFFKSLKATRIPPPLPREELKDVIFETARRSGLKGGEKKIDILTLKEIGITTIIASPGVPPPGKTMEAKEIKPSLIVHTLPDVQRPTHLTAEKIFNEGIRVHISSTRNIPSQCLDQRIKSFNRMHHHLAVLDARDAGADDVIMLDIYGNVSEGTYTNVWIAKDGSIFTPPGELLHGITRDTVFEMAQSENIKASELTMSPYDLYNADEVFFSTTGGGIIPIVEVDKRRVADGKPRRITKRLFNAYREWHVNPKYATLVLE